MFYQLHLASNLIFLNDISDIVRADHLWVRTRKIYLLLKGRKLYFDLCLGLQFSEASLSSWEASWLPRLRYPFEGCSLPGPPVPSHRRI
ncbi:hypothetical protein BpHYR1_043535 [Brachionus plicatilis]|uniref:Uncharacterized protein n=1 Tax=Brachionus plicatilis TaxID=10195 RepID=A0A3M7RRM7_BRAPC|nr:hypothetical protein BpHYR1_043535 [Brachionus plicatilis]